ncbi:MAG: DUF2809 domain-containing protein [Deltaproteobacteria bacterium]|jgi:hypothetical protein|nr:DUF2809 domain-containing protein [Deltaproteobacteria bacterium]
MRRWRAVGAAACLGAGLFVLVYRGPGWRPLRHFGGDLVVAPFLYFCLLVVTGLPRGRAAVGVWAFAVAVEALQALRLTSPTDPTWVQLTVGSTFDPVDLLAYTLGMILAYAADRAVGRRLGGAG